MMQGLANFVAQMLGSLVGAGLVLSTTVCEALLAHCATVVAFCAHRTIVSSPFVPRLYSTARQWCKLAAGIC